jgi:hypothetical protein
LRAIFKLASLSSTAQEFDLMRVASIDKLQLIASGKVTEIRLRSTVSQATSAYVRRKTQTLGILATAARHIKMIFGSDNDVSKDGLNVEMTIKTNRRDKKNLTLGETRIEQLAIKLIEEQEDGDDFRIVLADGQTISATEISVRSHKSIKALGKSVDRDDAWHTLVDYLRYLADHGIIEL